MLSMKRYLFFSLTAIVLLNLLFTSCRKATSPITHITTIADARTGGFTNIYSVYYKDRYHVYCNRRAGWKCEVENRKAGDNVKKAGVRNM